ncbi:hypothetical protein BD779DRAFT_988053 [Infundibulicybe gibba]|nr:hypothetical protein BD779DRAFT_988053 [Infundibulicybe gibba]
MFSKILPACFIVASGLVGVLSQTISPGRYMITNVAQGPIESGHTFVQPSSNSNNIVVAPLLNDEGIAVWDIVKSGGGFIMQNVQKRSFASAKDEPFAPVVVGDATEFEIQTWDDDSYYRVGLPMCSLNR